MATKTETKTDAEVIVTSNSKVVALIVAVVQAIVGAVSKKRALAEGIRSEADREGYDRKEASAMVAASYQTAYGLDKASEAEQKKFALKVRPDVSKVMSLAFPADKKAEAQLKLAYVHNDKLGVKAPKQERIGENNLLRIARGEVTTAELLAAKVKPASSGTAANGLDSVSTPQERFANSIKGILDMHKVGDKGKITVDEAKESFNTTLDAYLNPPKEKK